MADNYGQWFITKMFTDAEAAAVNSGKQITFKKMIASQDIFTQDDLATLTNSVLGTIDIKQQVNISTVLPSTGSYKVQGVFSNSTVTADYLMNTILLVGSYNGTEFLAAAQVANYAFKMPAASTGEQTIYTIAAQISVSNTATVSLTVDPDSIVTNAGLKVVTDAQAVKDSAQDVKISDLEAKDSQNVKITENQTINGVKSFTQKVTASISGNAGTATKLETSRKIDGKDFDGTNDVVLDVVHKTGDETIAGKKTFSNNVEIRGTLAVSSLTTTLNIGNGISIKFTKNGLGLVQAKFQGTLTTVKHGEEMRGTDSTWVTQNFCPPETISLVGHFTSGSDSFHIDIETTGRVVYWGPDTLTADARTPRGSAVYFAK